MKFQLKKIKDCKHALKIEVDEKAVGARYEEVYKQFQKKARLKGFREGKAPIELVRSTFKAEAEEEVVKTLVSDSYYEAARESKVIPVGMPEIRDLKMDGGKKLTFTAEFESYPQFNVKNYKGVKVQRPAAPVTEEDVDKAVLSLRESRAELEPVVLIRPVIEGDVLRCDVEVYQNGDPTPGRKDALFSLDKKGTPAEIVDQLIGSQVGETREITGEFNEEEKGRGLVGRKPMYRVVIKEIKTKRLPEADDAFAGSFGKENLDALKNQIREDIGKMHQSRSEERMKESIFEQLLQAHDIEVPDALVARQKERLLEQMGVPAGKEISNGHSKSPEEQKALESIEKQSADRARSQVKLFFILDKIAETEKIEPTAEEVEGRIKGLAAEMGRPEEEIRETFADDIYQNLRQAKTGEYLLANASIKEEKK